MKTLIAILSVVAALAIPAAALSHDGHGKGERERLRAAEHGHLVAVGTGSLTAGTFKGRPIAAGTYVTSIQTTGTTPPPTTTTHVTTTTRATTTLQTTTSAHTTTTATTTHTPPTPKPKPTANCMPATGTITLTATGGAAAAITETVQGRLCTKTSAEHGTKVAFFGRFMVTSATGVAAHFNGKKGLVAIVQIRDSTNFRFVELGGRKDGDDKLRHDGDHD